VLWAVGLQPIRDAGAEAIKVGIFDNYRSIARELVASVLKEQGFEARLIKARDISAGKLYDCDVMFFGGGWSGYNWVDLKGRMHLVEFVQKRGCGVIFSMFRCGSAARSMIRPIFPEVANAYNKANGKGLIVVGKEHPIAAGLPEQFVTPYWDHAVLKLGLHGRMIVKDTNGDVTIACGEVGTGRVVFLGPWIGVTSAGKVELPLADVDQKMLLNSVRWAAASPYRKSGGPPKLSEEVKLKVLRREKILDWMHEGRGISWYVGILTKAMYYREEKLDDLAFRTERLLEHAESRETSGELLRLHKKLGALKKLLRQNFEEAKSAKAAEISRMSIAELESDSGRTISTYRRMNKEQKALEQKRIEEWQDRLVAPHALAPVEAEVARFEGLLAGAIQKAKRERTGQEKAQDAKAVRTLIKQLDSRDPRARAAAALELGRIGEARAAKALTKAIRDRDQAVRRNAIQALGWMQARKVVPALLDLVEQTTDVWTKRRAIQALGQIGDPQATDLLINALEDPDHAVRQNAILSLGWLGGPKAVGPLTEILKAPEIDFGHSSKVFPRQGEWNREDVTCAIRALGHIGDQSTLPFLKEFAEKHKDKKDATGRHNPCLSAKEALAIATKEIEQGGRKERGLRQPDFLSLKEHFYWLQGKYNALYGRQWSYLSYPHDVNVLAGYAASSGGTGLIQWRSADGIAKRRPGADEYMAYFSELGLKQNPCFRSRSYAVFDKVGFEKDILRWGKYPALGGFWAEEALTWDGHLRNDEKFRAYLSNKYSRDELTALGIKNLAAVTCPPPDEGQKRLTYSWDGARSQKVLFAEYMEYLADTGVEIWREAQEWLVGARKGTYLTFSLSQRYTKGGSTYISAYPRISQVIGANGPQSYGAHSYMNNFHLDMVCDGEPRPAMGEFYQHQSDVPGRVERGFASSFLHGQCFFVWWWGHVFKHSPDTNAGSLCWNKGRWAAAERQFRKGRAISDYIAPQETETPKIVAQLYSGRTTTLTYGRGRVDGFGGYTSGGRMHRYTQNQQATWEAMLQSHLPVDMTWLETMSRAKLGRYKIAVLSDAYALKKEETDWIRDWVKRGGFLIATGGSSLHDQWDRPQPNYMLADVFGVDYVKTGLNGDPHDTYLFVDRDMKPDAGISKIEIKDETFAKHMEGQTTAEYEKGIGCDVVKLTTGKALGVWEDGSPAVVENTYGDGACLFLCPIVPGLSHVASGYTVDDLYKDYWPGARELIAGCVRRGLEFRDTQPLVTARNCPKQVELGVRFQPRHNRWIVHLLNYDPKLPVVRGVELKVNIRESRGVHAYYPFPQKAFVERATEDERNVLKVRDFSVHELIVLRFHRLIK